MNEFTTIVQCSLMILELVIKKNCFISSVTRIGSCYAGDETVQSEAREFPHNTKKLEHVNKPDKSICFLTLTG